MENKTPNGSNILTKISNLFVEPNQKTTIGPNSTKTIGVIPLSEKKISDAITAKLTTLETASNGTTSLWVILLIIMGLAFLGFNVFVYLAKGTQGIVDLFSPILKIIGYNTEIATKKVVNVSATGLQNLSGSIANATSSGPSPNPNTPVNNTPTTNQGQDYTLDESEQNIENSLNRAINFPSTKVSSQYTSDQSSSVIQQSKMSNKSGWCYIGEEKGFRSCASVGPSDVCMSGDIFPTQEVCINPNLRP